MDTSRDSRSTPMSASSTASRGAAASMSSPADSHAKMCPSQAREEDSTVNAPASGGKCIASFAKWDRDTSSWRTSQLSLAEGSTAFLGRWPTWGSMRNGACYRQPTSELPTFANDGGVSLPTPRSGKVSDEKEETWLQRQKDGKVFTPPLSLAVKMLPTPTKDCATERTSKYKQGGTSLSLAVKLLPTPTVQDAHNNAAPSQTKRNAMPLNVAVLHIPTPTAGDAKSSGTQNNPNSNANLGTSLTDFVREDGGVGRQPMTQDTPKLNPDWVELLMGWPRGWTALANYKPARGPKAGKRTALE